MKRVLDNNPVTSIIAVIVALVGGAVCLFDPDSINTWKEYAIGLGVTTVGLGALGYARSVGGKG